VYEIEGILAVCLRPSTVSGSLSHALGSIGRDIDDIFEDATMLKNLHLQDSGLKSYIRVRMIFGGLCRRAAHILFLSMLNNGWYL
jgi:hypothetical protein